MRSRFLVFVFVFALLAALPAAALAAKPPAKPGATTAAAQNVGPTGATLTGTVNPHGTDTTAYFQYGTTPAYSARTPNQAAGNGNGPIAENAAISGLTPNTIYHYRIVAVSSAGTTRGADRTFRTKLAPLPAAPEPSKLELARATIYHTAHLIDILAPITARASGNVSLDLYAAGQHHMWTAPIDAANARIRNRETIPNAQAAMGTGILTMTYPGDPDTRPQVVRLRAANTPANLDAVRPTLVNGRLQAHGTVSTSARGVVRVQLEYFSAETTTTIEKTATIANGTWTLDAQLTPEQQAAIAARRGVVHSYILFTGYLPARMRGEMQSYEVLGAP